MTREQAETAIEALINRASDCRSQIEHRRFNAKMKDWLRADIAKCRDAWEALAASFGIEIEEHRLTQTKSLEELSQ